MIDSALQSNLDKWRQGRKHGFFITAQQARDAEPVHFEIEQMPNGVFPKETLNIPDLLMVAMVWVDSEADLWPVCRWETMNMAKEEQARWGMVFAKLLERRFGGMHIIDVSSDRGRKMDDTR